MKELFQPLFVSFVLLHAKVLLRNRLLDDRKLYAYTIIFALRKAEFQLICMLDTTLHFTIVLQHKLLKFREFINTHTSYTRYNAPLY